MKRNKGRKGKERKEEKEKREKGRKEINRQGLERSVNTNINK